VIIVVDASLAAKWVLHEDDSDRAETLLQRAIQAGDTLAAPPHFRSEVINAIYQRFRSSDPTKHISEGEAQTAIAQFLQTPVEIMTPADLYPKLFLLCRDHRLPSVYDAMYLVLADILSAEFWTADRRLFAAVEASLN
jgi:predicted nucleic acid-binding protein